MKGCRATIVSLIYIHIFYSDKVIKRGRLITLRCYVQYVCSIHVLSSEVCLHNLCDKLN
jgi:hypothetical protein